MDSTNKEPCYKEQLATSKFVCIHYSSVTTNSCYKELVTAARFEVYGPYILKDMKVHAQASQTSNLS